MDFVKNALGGNKDNTAQPAAAPPEEAKKEGWGRMTSRWS